MCSVHIRCAAIPTFSLKRRSFPAPGQQPRCWSRKTRHLLPCSARISTPPGGCGPSDPAAGSCSLAQAAGRPLVTRRHHDENDAFVTVNMPRSRRNRRAPLILRDAHPGQSLKSASATGCSSSTKATSFPGNRNLKEAPCSTSPARICAYPLHRLRPDDGLSPKHSPPHRPPHGRERQREGAASVTSLRQGRGSHARL